MKAIVFLLFLFCNECWGQLAPEVKSEADQYSSTLGPVPGEASPEDLLKQLVIEKMIEELIKIPSPKGFDFLKLYQSIQSEIKIKTNLGSACEDYARMLINEVSLNEKQLDNDWIRKYGLIVLKSSLDVRYKLRETMKDLSVECRTTLKEVFFEMRLTEDMIGAIYYGAKPISDGEISQLDKFIPVLDQKNLNPPLIPSSLEPEKFDYQSGDIFMVKGKTIAGSVVSELSIPKTLFSHLAIVHVDENTHKVNVIQIFGNTFLKIYSLKDFLAFDNMRIVLFRPLDKTNGAKAASYILNKVKEYNKNKIEIPYDFEARYSDHTSLDCAEVIYQAYKEGTGNKFILPEIQSEISFTNPNLMKRLMIKNGARMFPGDIELDTRFQIRWEWTNYKLIRESWMRDAVIGSIYTWANQHRYKLKDNIYSLRTKYIWMLRNVPGVWSIITYFFPSYKDLNLHTPPEILSTTILFKSMEKRFLKQLRDFDNNHYVKQKRWLSNKELRDNAEKFRINRYQLVNYFFDPPGK